MRFLVALLGAVLLALCVPSGAAGAGVNVFIGSPTIPVTIGPVAASLFVSPSGAGATCSQASPCVSWEAAYVAASAGQIIEVAAGTYSAVNASLDGLAAKGGAAVTYRVATGATATINGETDYRTLDGITLDGTTGANGQGLNYLSTTTSFIAIGYNGGGTNITNFTLKGARMGGNSPNVAGQAIWLSGCANILLQDIEIYSLWRGDGIQFSKVGTDTRCNNVTVDRAYLHDFDGIAPADHQDAYQVRAGSNITVRANRIFDINTAGSQGYFINPTGDLADGGAGFVLENSIIANVNGNELYLGGVTDVALRGNTIVGGIGSCGGGTPPCLGILAAMKGNLLDVACADLNAIYDNRASDAIWSGNVTNANCDGLEQIAPAFGVSMFAAPGTRDYHLISNAFAIGKGDQVDFPALDVDAQSRPQGGSVDAGADER